MMTNRTIRIGSGPKHLEFTLAESRVRLSRIGELPGAPDVETPLWRLSLRGPDGARRDVSADEAEFTAMERDATKASFTWGLQLNGGNAIICAGADSAAAMPQWSLSVTLPEGWAVAEAAYPQASLTRTDDMALAVPTCWGLEKPVQAGLHYQEAYPSWGAVMQFLALYTPADGLYFAAHDPSASLKEFRVDADETSVTLSCTHLPAIVDGAYRLGYDVVLGAISGGYMGAAARYREFALTAPWTQAGPVSQRPIPQWLQNTDLWLKPGETPWTDDDAECIAATKANVEWCRKAKEYFDVPISLHWYRWHQIPYDTLYPEYFPPKAGFADGVKEAQEAGFKVMPYINGRLCDPESDTWKSEAHKWAARDEEGKPYTEVYGSKVPLDVMCPSTPFWQETIAGLVKRLTEEIGVDGVYIDQITCAKAERCFAEGHAHGLGGGDHWAQGYRTLLKKVREQLRPDGMITSEECMECWMDLMDAHLVLNSPCGEGEMIPLYPAVYSDYTVTFGFQYFPPSESVISLGFRSKVARGFLWGTQLGWIDAERLMAPGAEAERDLLRNLCRARRDAHDFLQYGRFLGAVEVGGDNPSMTEEAVGSFSGTYHLELPAVMASAWRAEDGRTAIAICNMDDAAHDVEVSTESGPMALALAAREARVIADNEARA